MAVPILRHGRHLIASAQAALSDEDWRTLREELVHRVGEMRATGVVLDVTALDVLDSFATRTLRQIAQATRLRGANTVIVGIQPDVAFAMVQLGLTARLEGVRTGLDLEDGLRMLGEAGPDGSW